MLPFFIMLLPDFNPEILERLSIFDKIIRMVQTSDNLLQLPVCRKYYEQYKEWYFVSAEKEMEFERNFEQKQDALIKEKIKLENNE